jgi:ADP-ribosyl-[dinitrogen reductase] hydrolase
MSLASIQSLATHPSPFCQIACAAYAAIAYMMLNEKKDIAVAADMAFYPCLALFQKSVLTQNVTSADIDAFIEAEDKEVTGSGFVVDSFYSALYAVKRGKSFEETIKLAIELGNDTDTTACIAGGLAGIKYGYSGIPERWISSLRGRETIENILTTCL